MSLITLTHLTYRYGAHLALDDVSLVLEPGAIGLLGPNGAGKSTLLRLLLGLLAPTAGGGSVLGLDLQGDSGQRRGLVGYMTEADALVPGLKGVEYVTLAGELCGMPYRDAQRRAHELLTFLGLEEARYRKLEEYSTGMKQRIKLAQALVHDPPLLLLDEPTSGLDPAGRDDMLSLLRLLVQEHGKSLLLSTHVLGDVERVCSQVVILVGGRVVRQGRVDELRTSRRDRYRLEMEPAEHVAAFIGALQSAGLTVLSSESQREVSVAVPEGWSTRGFFALARDADVLIRGLQRDDEDLDQLFHRVMDEEGRGEAQRGSEPPGAVHHAGAAVDQLDPAAEARS
ncbi:MAG TPA: ABC transporter ATP-binding protein [Gemmatales bacterium]|nr:ABC transporter ATP-binding protein [Gemmatales bacterium]